MTKLKRIHMWETTDGSNFRSKVDARIHQIEIDFIGEYDEFESHDILRDPSQGNEVNINELVEWFDTNTNFAIRLIEALQVK